ncbi:MAG: helix-turn-helix transcriptional regulator [Chloroflexi bacterium]|nr:helix-turn-helix transcriptional regulator [Chloroflexota bacterium]
MPAVTPRPIVRDFGGLQGRPEVTFDPRTVFDFVISLNVAAGEEADLLPEDAAWLRRARETLPAGLQRDLDKCFGETSMGAFHALPSVVLARPDVEDAEGFMAAMQELQPDGLVRLLLADLLRQADADEMTDRILAGDSDALDEAKVRFDEFNKGEIMTFLRDPVPAVARMVTVLEAWLPSYQQIEPRVREMLDRDIAGRRQDRESLAQDALLEKTTGGIRWLPEPRVRRIVMAPSYFARPYNYIYQGSDWRLFAYPVADTAIGPTDAGVPPQAVVRLYRALGDVTRMRTLKLLADRDYYLTELAQHLELSKPTMKHHLALLRAAGLVTVTEEGSLTYYSLRRERLEEAGVELRRFIG